MEAYDLAGAYAQVSPEISGMDPLQDHRLGR
jgi:hypothetical protein